MTAPAAPRLVPRAADLVDTGSVLDALADSVLMVGPDGGIRYANAAAEQFFEAGRAWLYGQRLQDLLPEDSPLFTLIGQALAGPSVVSEHGVALTTPRIGEHFVTIQVAPIADEPDCAVVSFHEQSIARKIDGQLTHRSAARSVSAMAAMLAHEVKNPLSGIRGAAQLLEEGVDGGDRQLTRLICEETDRICALVDDMEVFSDQRPIARSAVNIHEVLNHVRRLAQAGFARGLKIKESYDPSLPPVYGNRDQLVQVFLNLIKNACEAAPEDGGEIRVQSAYRHGVRLAVPGSDQRVALPLMVSVQDNGEGIPHDLRPHLFDPFVTTRAKGKGLGLALVAKIINDHGGVIEFDSEPRRTVFRVMLPAATETP
ncbi:MAG: ATP-binding protein [Alphaproteobacteria bacterium]|nr:ATP-binding protein [Alphaproteobacteria bacterium]